MTKMTNLSLSLTRTRGGMRVHALSLAPLGGAFFLDGACPLSDFVREDASLLRRACMRIVSFEKRMRIESDGASIL
tara:strand:- start:108 stop:335 length:228 start_codon:yes stop_codon:yes gene_type:complete